MTEEKRIYKITIWGIVQGVGFRPFVAKLARRMQVAGRVRNAGGVVELLIRETPAGAEAFVRALQEEKPLPAEIVHIKTEELGEQAPPARPGREAFPEAESVPEEGFVIDRSCRGDSRVALLPADLAICPDCLAEMQDPGNPRHLHPFISCMACGPRYTIIDRIPYDRENTSMEEFPMCAFCEGEYTDPENRRYHAQTVSCHHCGPVLKYRLAEERDGPSPLVGIVGAELPETVAAHTVEPIMEAARLLRRGRTVAWKAVGGYNFLCSPFSEEAVARLRRLKGREEKPFAVMFRDLEQVREYCLTEPAEERLLSSSARPILLLPRREERFCFDVCRSSRYIGAFLPSMGAQWLLLNQCGPLVATSANLSDRPIFRTDGEMMDFFEKERAAAAAAGESPPLAGVFYNERKIRVAVDDSVVRVIDGRPQMMRRSKGYAPAPLFVEGGSSLGDEAMVLAAGGDLKSAFCLTKGPFAYVSQYFGDLDTVETETVYKENVERMKELFRIEPVLAVCDLHPGYRSGSAARGYEQAGLPLLRVQHHHAHAASVMAEHGLRGPVLGVSFDGTGYGEDGAVWGGEFLLCEGGGFRRGAHLEYVEMTGGDPSMKDGKKSALCYLYHCGLARAAGVLAAEGASSPEEAEAAEQAARTVKAALSHGINSIRSSSMGRLFDGAASLSGVHHVNSYEGECAVRLENAGAEALERGLPPLPMAFELKEGEGTEAGVLLLSSRRIIETLAAALLSGERPPAPPAAPLGPSPAVFRGAPTASPRYAPFTDWQRQAALGFHYAVAEAILHVCLELRRREGVEQVALSGGVFQNKILMERTLLLLRREGFRPYYNISVSPNDGGVCLGQAFLGMEYLKEREG
ncbi:MAG: carbamoyltransferase HypF, partial [Bacillota bacterium]|nr:carbamoyltransferase HypF [Bacillota bacterium]